MTERTKNQIGSMVVRVHLEILEKQLLEARQGKLAWTTRFFEIVGA